MKKIVALVLSLVMVLGLATTAFAAPAPANYYDASDLTTALGTAADTAYSLEAYTTGAEAAKTYDQVAVWATNKLNGAKTLVDTFVVAASADSADYAFVNGKAITYLNSVATAWTVKVSKVATVEYDDVDACGDVYTGNDVALYADANGVLYVEGGATAGNVDGKYVALTAATKYYVELDDVDTATGVALAGEVVTVKHTYAADTKTVAGETEVTSVVCTECKAAFAFVEGVEAQAIAKFGAGNYVSLGNGLYVSVAAGVDAPAADGEKVESAETFDAGIAMYVGMSVMAAAGSAVVLKKKD